ncbi:MAG: helix-turn-helix domain-containing protein [Synergistaceae bacterium]|nr:helix-turn-helix domain-containing protein [Synergistaceae bacterium]
MRERRGLTQEKLGSALGVSIKTVQRWEQGLRDPRAGELRKLAEALGVSEMALLDGPAPEEWTLEVKLGESRKEVIDMSATMGNVAEVSCSREGASLLLTGKWDTFRDDAKFEDFVSQLRAARGLILHNGDEMEKMRPAAVGA